MTVIVGVRCTNGVVVGSDSAMTFGAGPGMVTIEQQHPNKISIVRERIIVAGTGQTGLGQRFIYEVEKLWENNEIRNSPTVEIGRKLSEAVVKNFSSTKAPRGEFGALVALPVNNVAELVEIQMSDLQPDVKTGDVWYASMGAGQSIADPLLGFVREAFWRTGAPKNLREGVFASTFVLKLACSMSPFGVAPPLQMAMLYRDRENKGQWTARRLSQPELLEHEESVEGAIQQLGEYGAKLAGDDMPPTGPPGPPAP